MAILFPNKLNSVVSNGGIVAMGYGVLKGFGSTKTENTSKNSLPIKQDLKMGYSKSRTVTKRKRSKKGGSKKVSVKQEIMRMSEAKHLTYEAGVTVNDNTMLAITPSQMIIRGTTSQQRVGDQVYFDYLKLRGYFFSGTQSKGYNYRIIVGYSTYEIGNTSIGQGLYGTELFLQNTHTQLTRAIINPKNFTTLLDKTYEVNSNVVDSRTHINFIEHIKLAKNFQYKQEGSIYGKTQNLVCLFIGYANDTTDNTSIGFVDFALDLCFKDF